MYQDGKIWIGKAGEEDAFIYTKMANRHGMIAGATGTGKTVTLKVLAESFSDAGVPVFLADVKGDLSGMCKPGENSGTVAQRIEAMGLFERGFSLHAYPTSFWDIYGEKGINMRTTISEMGPLLLGRILGLNDIQSVIYDEHSHQTWIQGTLDTPNPQDSKVELFIAQISNNPLTQSQGKTYIGTVNPNPNGQWQLIVENILPTENIIATATDANSNTSEFSNAVTNKWQCYTCNR